MTSNLPRERETTGKTYPLNVWLVMQSCDSSLCHVLGDCNHCTAESHSSTEQQRSHKPKYGKSEYSCILYISIFMGITNLKQNKTQIKFRDL